MSETLLAETGVDIDHVLPNSEPIELIGRSSAIGRIKDLVRRAQTTDSAVLLTAEPGIDLDSIAEHLHRRSRCANGPYVTVNCDSTEPGRLDQQLFGSPAGDAPSDLESVSADGLVAAARGGTLFLRQVAELPAAVQARLARIARDGELRVDGVPVATAWRLIASSLPTIDADARAHRFRADLLRRLSAIRIDVPALRDRSEDVPAIAERLLAEGCARRGGRTMTFTPTALSLIASLTWPGNVSELGDAIGRIIDADGADPVPIEQVVPALQLHRAPAPFVPAASLREARLRFEREYIAAVLQHHGWRMADAAHTLGIQRPNLYRKARQLGISLMRASE
ncbi:MAG TPA: sigma 54-interacting transcriptional regulator [Vicinamibacterales bacterium]|nr:sigma 54-interacting transcriptional regulator [Vicinamibacterales bacterium]